MENIVGHYSWTRLGFIGEGSFGKVYKGHDIKTKEQVAIKVINMKYFKSKKLYELLKTEINVMK